MFRRGAEVLERRDREAGERWIARFWHEDCEWVPLIAGVEGGTTYRGREGILEFYEDYLASFDVRYGDLQFEESGDFALLLTTMKLRGRESGVEVEGELGVVWRFDGDRIRRGQAYGSHAEARAAVEEPSDA